jgi:hypothetical protein
MFHVEVLRVVTPCSVVVGYHRFRCPCCLHLQDEVKHWYPTTTQRASTSTKLTPSRWDLQCCIINTEKLHHVSCVASVLLHVGAVPYKNINKFSITRVYPNVSGLAACNENCKWYGSLPLGAVVSLFYESV